MSSAVSIDTVLVNAAPGETRVALVAAGRLVEVWIDRPGRAGGVGDIHLGRVERLLPAIEAAFVNIGTNRSGFLAAAEARPPEREGGGISDFVSEGDAVVVQTTADAVDDKGPRLTKRLTLPGRYLVATPGQTDIRISRRIAGEDERDRLLDLVKEIAEPKEGFIVRTAAARADRSDLARDICALRLAANEVKARQAKAKAPALLYRELDPLRRILRDTAGPGLERIIVDDPNVLAEIRRLAGELAPEAAGRIDAHSGRDPVFETDDVEAQIDAALAPEVALPGGGRLIIEETRSVTVIDVDSGGHTVGGPEETALTVNLEAVAEIARQMRLRNLAGHLVVDFVSMRQRDNEGQVVEATRHAVADDPTQTHVAGFTRLGLVEMTRQRGRASLADELLAAASGGRRKSPETVALETLRQVLREAAANPAASVAVTAAPAVAAALQGSMRDAVATVEKRLGRPLPIDADTDMAVDRADVHARTGGGRNG